MMVTTDAERLDAAHDRLYALYRQAFDQFDRAARRYADVEAEAPAVVAAGRRLDAEIAALSSERAQLVNADQAAYLEQRRAGEPAAESERAARQPAIQRLDERLAAKIAERAFLGSPEFREATAHLRGRMELLKLRQESLEALFGEAL